MAEIILGGTHGLGSEIANELREQGQSTFIVGRSYLEAEHGAGARVDLADLESCYKLADSIRKMGKTAVGGFWWVAGYGYNGDFEAQEDPQKMAAVNFSNVMPIAQSAYDTLLNGEETGRFVVVSSTTGLRAREDEAVYAATKHAQVGYARSLGLEAERVDANMRVSLFMPGGMNTPFWEGNEPSNIDEFLDPQKVAKHIVDSVYEQRKVNNEEIIERGSL